MSRERVEEEKKKLPKKFTDFIDTCCEINLYFIINHIGGFIWRMEHDLADGRIECPSWDTNDKFIMQAEIECAVLKSTRFGVDPVKEDGYSPTDSYWKWFRWWDSYVRGLPEEEWQKIVALTSALSEAEKLNATDTVHIIEGKINGFRPEGNWKE